MQSQRFFQMEYRLIVSSFSRQGRSEIGLRFGVGGGDADCRFELRKRFIDLAGIEEKIAEGEMRDDITWLELQSGLQFLDRLIAVPERQQRCGQVQVNAEIRGI